MVLIRVLICGSRGWDDPTPIDALLAGYDVLAEGKGEKLILIHGDAPGADRMAKRLGKRWNATVIDEPADWETHGKGAGFVRNQKMLDDWKPEVVWAFRSYGKSNGTDDMIERSEKAGIPVFVVNGGPRV